MNSRIKSAYIWITVHYFILILVAVIIARFFPGFVEFLPVGPAADFFKNPQYMELGPRGYAGRMEGQSALAVAVFFLICFLSALLLALPVSLTYMATRRGKKWTTPLIRLIVVLPVAVTGLVMIVQNSLALAFSLVGMVAGSGIRFRNVMREVSDTTFFMICIGIGLSAGTGAIGLALILSGFFCYAYLTLHASGYGELPKKEKPAAVEASPEPPEAPAPPAPVDPQ
jgi:hypothetical protein